MDDFDPTELFGLFAELEAAVPAGVLALDSIEALLWLRGEGRATSGQLAQALSFSRAKATRMCSHLRELGLLEEQISSDDLRKCYFRLSNRGENAAFEIMRKVGRDRAAAQLEGYVALRRGRDQASEAAGVRLSSTAYSVLLTLRHAGVPLAVGEVAARTNAPESRASMCLDRLRRAGLVRGRLGERDMRVHVFELTEAGTAALAVPAT